MATGHFEFPDNSYSFTATFKEFQPLEEQKPANVVFLTDDATAKRYRLHIINGKLTMTEVDAE